MMLALALVPAIVGDYFWGLSERERRVYDGIQLGIWVAFAVDLVVKTGVAPDRIGYLRRNWVIVLLVVVPFLRPLRVLRVFVLGGRAAAGFHRLFGIANVLMVAYGLVVVAATLVYTFERGHNDQFRSFPDALWWGLVTITTVGYGDKFPITAPGRLSAVLLLIGGIAMFGAVAGHLAALLSRPGSGSNAGPPPPTQDLLDEVRALRREVAELRAGRPQER